jgi:hypothetical protein
MSAPGERVCASPDCRAALPPPAGRGRPRLYCSPACRRRAVTRDGGSLVVELDHDPVGAGRPSGRIWLLRLRRGSRQVVVASELGRPSAEHLAHQLDTLVRPRRRAGGGTIG